MRSSSLSSSSLSCDHHHYHDPTHHITIITIVIIITMVQWRPVRKQLVDNCRVENGTTAQHGSTTARRVKAAGCSVVGNGAEQYDAEQ
jgi:hypothetical protein